MNCNRMQMWLLNVGHEVDGYWDFSSVHAELVWCVV